MKEIDVFTINDDDHLSIDKFNVNSRARIKRILGFLRRIPCA